jgi:hypothetical protein
MYAFASKERAVLDYTELPKDLDENSATPKSFVEIKEWDVLNWTESWCEIKYSKLKCRIEISPG